MLKSKIREGSYSNHQTPLTANNQRVAKKVNGTVIEKYLWKDLTTLLTVYNPDDSIRTRFEYADGRMPYRMSHNAQTYYLSYDQVGSLRVVTNEDGTIVKTIEYGVFGDVLSDSNPSFKVPFGFAGGLYDPDTGLTRFGYHDYDAETGKWTAKDPVGFNGGDANLYGYVLGDPVNLVDPRGEHPLILSAIRVLLGAGVEGYFVKLYSIASRADIGRDVLQYCQQVQDQIDFIQEQLNKSCAQKKDKDKLQRKINAAQGEKTKICAQLIVMTQQPIYGIF